MIEDKNCHVEPIQNQAGAEELSNIERKQLFVSGMGCPNCSNRVRNSLLGLEGVSEALVDHQRGVAIVDFNPTMATLEDLARAVSSAGGDGRHEYSATLAA